MITVYGYSDDLVEIERDGKFFTEIDCFDRAVRVSFSDGTVIRVSYGKTSPKGESLGIWQIKVTKKGTAPHSLSLCFIDTGERYSDEFTIDAEVVAVRRV